MSCPGQTVGDVDFAGDRPLAHSATSAKRSLRQAFSEIVGAEPVWQRNLGVGRLARIPEPDSRLSGELLDVGPSVGSEYKGRSVSSLRLAPDAAIRRARHKRGGREADVARVTARLIQHSRDVLPLGFGLDYADAPLVDEEGVADRSLVRRPFGDGEPAADLRAGSTTVSEHICVSLPARCHELGVREHASVHLIDDDPARRTLNGLQLIRSRRSFGSADRGSRLSLSEARK